MAKFRLYLLNLKSAEANEGDIKYLAQPISIFSNEIQSKANYNQVVNDSFCYSYNEKFSIKTNAQRSLTFSMDKTITREDRLEENPFISYLAPDAQLLLVDKNGQHHIMTIVDIAKDIKEHNITYNYTCEDSFSFQLARRNAGYEITNDTSSDDFLGAHKVDWWANKIVNECQVNYQYKTLEDSFEIQLQKTLDDDYFITKPQYKPTTHADFFESIVFSGSGTANSMLINLGQMLGLQLKVYEYYDFEKQTVDKCFWFESEKSLTPSGMYYSPNNNIQSLGLTSSGKSLASVLNVQSHTINDELISLLPSVPTFFSKYFNTVEKWNNEYQMGLYTNLQNNLQLISSNGYPNLLGSVESIDDLISIQEQGKPFFVEETKELLIPIDKQIIDNLLPQYEFLRFYDDNNKSNLTYTTSGGQYTSWSNYSNWKLTWLNIKYTKYQFYESLAGKDEWTFKEFSIKNTNIPLSEITNDITTNILDEQGQKIFNEGVFDNVAGVEVEEGQIKIEERVNAKILIVYEDLKDLTTSTSHSNAYLYEGEGQIYCSFSQVPYITSDNNNITNPLTDYGGIAQLKKTSNLEWSIYISDSSDSDIYVLKALSLGENKYCDLIGFSESTEFSRENKEGITNLILDFTPEVQNTSLISSGFGYNIQDYLTTIKNNTVSLFISIPTNVEEEDSNITIDDFNIYFNQKHYFNEEEESFALIADQIPWLENKLIDLKYFLDHKIITKFDYTNIINKLENELRRANAKMLIYSKMYYQAIQQKTKIISDLSSKIDLIGATFNSDVVQTYTTNNGKITDTTDFQVALSSLITDSNTTSLMLDYNETIVDYFNKYVTAEQTFFKNISAFKQYFNENTNIGSLYKYTITISQDENSDTIYRFNSSKQYERFNNTHIDGNNNPKVPAYKNINGNYVLVDNIVTSDNYYTSGFYKLNEITEPTQLTSGENIFHDDWNYYEKQWKIEFKISNYAQEDNANIEPSILYNDIASGSLKWIIDDIKKDKETVNYTGVLRFYQHRIENEEPKFSGLVWYGQTDTTEKKYTLSYGHGETSSTTPSEYLEEFYKKVTWLDIKLNYLYKTIKNQASQLAEINAYYHKDCEYLPINNNTVPLFKDLKLEEDALKLLTNNNENFNFEDSTAQQTYAAFFPLTSIGYYVTQSNSTAKDNKDVNTIISVPFINYTNADQFYRKISVSLKEREGWNWAWTSITGAIARGIAQIVWENGYKELGQSGWTYHDIYNRDISQPNKFSGYYTGNEIVYAKNCNLKEDVNSKDVVWNSNKQIQKWQQKDAENIILTYNSLRQYFSWGLTTNNNYDSNDLKNYCYKPNYWRVLTQGDYVYKNRKYLLMPLKLGEGSIITDGFQPYEQFGSLSKYRINSIIFYPLANAMTNYDFSDYEWGTDDRIELTDAFITNLMGESYNFSTTYQRWTPNDSKFIYILEEANYDYAQVSSLQNIDDRDYSKLATENWYDPETDEQINLMTLTDITNDFYIKQSEVEPYVLAKDQDDAWYEKNYYTKDGDTYTRIFTAPQMVNQQFYVDKRDTHIIYSWTPLKEINLNCFKYDNSEEYKGKEAVKVTEDGIPTTDGTSTTFNSFTIALETNDYNNLTNGEFWYNYYQTTNNSFILEQAMLIETQLMEYWTNAYYASKNCRFFLPEYWQPKVDQENNFFSPQILVPQVKEGLGHTKVTLNNKFFPNVEKLYNQPYYQFKHATTIESEQGGTIIPDSNKGSYELFDWVPLDEIANQQVGYSSIINYLELADKINDFFGVRIKSNSIFYNYLGGGVTWLEIAQELTSSEVAQSSIFGGWYDMMIKTLVRSNYSEYQPHEYLAAKEEHDGVWNELYKRYPEVFLEQSFTDENSTTSAELMQKAKIAFKGYNKVENNYSMTVLDPYSSLQGFYGQELFIGDAIQLRADEFGIDYDTDDYNALKQFLYISDISYNLREDKDIAITVNDIKYSDKVINQLVKLIR